MLRCIAMIAATQIFLTSYVNAQIVPLSDKEGRIVALINTNEIQAALISEEGIKVMLKGADREWAEIDYPNGDMEFFGEVWLGQILAGSQN